MLFPSGTPNCCASFGLPAEGPPRARVSTARCRTWRGAAGSPAPAAGRPRQEAAGRARICGRRQLLFLCPTLLERRALFLCVRRGVTVCWGRRILSLPCAAQGLPACARKKSRASCDRGGGDGCGVMIGPYWSEDSRAARCVGKGGGHALRWDPVTRGRHGLPARPFYERLAPATAQKRRAGDDACEMPR